MYCNYRANGIYFLQFNSGKKPVVFFPVFIGLKRVCSDAELTAYLYLCTGSGYCIDMCI